MNQVSKHSSHPVWALQDAKARFSAMIRASAKGPQFISVRGEEEAVILSKKQYQRLLEKKKTFIDFINESPFKGLALELKRDRSPDREIEL